MADGVSGLQIIDISSLSAPNIVGNYDTPGDAMDVFVSGNLAYVADAASGLQVIDVSDPVSAVFAGSYDTPGSAWGVFVSGNYIYVADSDSLQILQFIPGSASAQIPGAISELPESF
jgi:hypothetical protein